MSRLGFGDARIFDDPQIQDRVRALAAEGAVASVVAGTNVTVDNTDPAHPRVSAAGGASGLARSAIGTTTIGADGPGVYANGQGVWKQILLAKSSLISSVAAHCRGAGGAGHTWLSAGVMTDNAGSPGEVIGAAQGAKIHLLGTLRWITTPLGVWVAAGTYWIGVVSDENATNLDVDGANGGSDVTITTPDPSAGVYQVSGVCDFADASATSVTTLDHSLYANVLS